jgi:hypothetical protein
MSSMLDLDRLQILDQFKTVSYRWLLKFSRSHAQANATAAMADRHRAQYVRACRCAPLGPRAAARLQVGNDARVGGKTEQVIGPESASALVAGGRPARRR